MEYDIKVWRQRNAKAKGHFETYHVTDVEEDASFLEMLDILNDQLVLSRTLCSQRLVIPCAFPLEQGIKGRSASRHGKPGLLYSLVGFNTRAITNQAGKCNPYSSSPSS